MPTFDDRVNFAASTITVAPSPATSGTTFTMGGTNWPTPPFNVTVWPSGQKPSSSNSEIIRVTARTGGAVTSSIRAQEGTTAKAITTTYQVTAGITAKALDDIEKGALMYYNVEAFGASHRNDVDSTAAIDAAWAAVRDDNNNLAGGFTHGVLYFPPGQFVYNGTGLATTAHDQRINIMGSGQESTTIFLGASSRFIVSGHRVGSLNVEGIEFQGGIDVIKKTYTNAEIGGVKRVHGCHFYGYTGVAIQNNSNDEPYWQIRGNRFQAADQVASMGVALSGDTSGATISQNAFVNNRIHIKMGTQSGIAAKVIDNDFIQNATGATQRATIWHVPAVSANFNPGYGFICQGNKFGPENLQATDKPILFADESAGADNGTRFPDMTTSSTGWTIGHDYSSNVFGNIDSGGAPLLTHIAYSTTPNISSCRFGPNVVAGSHFAEILRFKDTVIATPYNQSNVFYAPDHYYAGIDTIPTAPSNRPGMGRFIDDQRQYSAQPGTHAAFPGGASSAGFLDLLTVRSRGLTVFGTGSKTADLTDYLGGIDAAEWNFAVVGTEISAPFSATPLVGIPAIIELSLKAATTSPLASLQVYVGYGGGSRHLLRLVPMPTNWTRYRFEWTPREATAGFYLVFGSAVTGRFQLARPVVYQAREPVVLDGPVLMSPDGSKYRLLVANGGALSTVVV